MLLTPLRLPLIHLRLLSCAVLCCAVSAMRCGCPGDCPHPCRPCLHLRACVYMCVCVCRVAARGMIWC